MAIDPKFAALTQNFVHFHRRWAEQLSRAGRLDEAIGVLSRTASEMPDRERAVSGSPEVRQRRARLFRRPRLPLRWSCADCRGAAGAACRPMISLAGLAVPRIEAIHAALAQDFFAILPPLGGDKTAGNPRIGSRVAKLGNMRSLVSFGAEKSPSSNPTIAEESEAGRGECRK